MKEKEIKKLYFDVIREKTLRTKDKMGWVSIDTFESVIHYKHYGSSAIKDNYEDFKWLINEIFTNYTFNDFIIT